MDDFEVARKELLDELQSAMDGFNVGGWIWKYMECKVI
jgi:hypothetical protein